MRVGLRRGVGDPVCPLPEAGEEEPGRTCDLVREKYSYTTTDRYFQRLIKIMSTVFQIIGVCV